MNSFNLKILAINGEFYSGEAISLTIETLDGMYGIQAMHRDTILAIIPGLISYTNNDNEIQELVVSNGLVKIEKNNVLVLVQTCYNKEDYELNLEKEEQERLKEEQNQRDSLKEYAKAQTKIADIMTKLSRKIGDDF